MPETPREPPPRETTRWHYRAGLTGTGCAGCAPLVNAGGALFVGLARERFGIDVGARADLPSTATSTGGREVSASLLLGELFPHVRLGPARLGVLGSVGTLAGESEGVRQSSLWSAVGVRAGVEWAFARPIFLRAALDGELVLGRVSLRADGVEVWSSPGLVAGLAVGLGVEL